MFYKKQEILDFIEEEDVKFIRLAFCDVLGTQKNVSIMASELERAFDDGISFDASAICGFGSEDKSDFFLFPDPSTLAVLPWRPSQGRVVRLFCDIKHPDGKAFELDVRHLLKQAVSAAKKKGITCSFGAEYEFYLFKTDEDGNPTKTPFDNAGYMDIAPEDTGENVRREICLTLAEMGIAPETSHHEEGPGQHEIDFKYGSAIVAADNATTFKSVVKTVAARNGLYASFSPKPLPDKSGNGFHINMSLKCDDGKDRSKSFMAGIMKHICEITAFLNPTGESYARLGEKKAPKHVTWSPENRSQLIRIPAAKGEYERIELRSPDPSANPYIAFALLIHAGLDGIINDLPVPEPTSAEILHNPAKSGKQLETLPDNLSAALIKAGNSEFVRKVLPAGIIETYCSSAR
jgi:glutamine synthetase